jgi:Resolvase, N terminal domain
VKKGSIKPVRCAIYTRVSTDYGLEQDFNSLDAQHDAAQAYIRSQAHAGWMLIRSRYADGGYSGGSIERPALQRLLADVRARKVDVIVVYKVDRLTRSLADFAKLVELFDGHGVSFVSVTQQFNTTNSRRGCHAAPIAGRRFESCGRALRWPWPIIGPDPINARNSLREPPNRRDSAAMRRLCEVVHICRCAATGMLHWGRDRGAIKWLALIGSFLSPLAPWSASCCWP